MKEYEEEFYLALEEVQASRPDLIEPDVDVRDEFGLFRSSRRGVMIHSMNKAVPENVRRTLNCWRTEMNSKTGGGLSIEDVYSDLAPLKPLVLVYSQML